MTFEPLVIMRLPSRAVLSITERKTEKTTLYSIAVQSAQLNESLAVNRDELAALYEALRGLKSIHPEVFQQ